MADLISILGKGYSEWNNWVTNNPSELIDLRNQKLLDFCFKKCNLSKAKFNNGTFTHANFSNSKLNNALFCQASLKDSIFIRSQLEKTNFIEADLRKAIFQHSQGTNANFREANLFRAKMEYSALPKSDFINADLRRANLSNTNFSHSTFYLANLRGVNFKNANLQGASFVMANLTDANLENANLENANLQGAQLISSNLSNANLNGCQIYGISAWGINDTNAKQTNLILSRNIITKSTRTLPKDPIITVDSLEVAQFVYLLLTNSKIRTIIDTVTSKVILILGRFTKDRLAILEEIRNELRNKNYLPVLFDFENAENRDITETVSTLAHLSRFIIADLTDAKSIPQELSVIVPNLPSVPVQPILNSLDKEYGMFEHFKNFPWVQKTIIYSDIDDLKKVRLEEGINNAEKYLLSSKLSKP